ncbi:MAG: transcriptional regulator [Candidatus Bathyarchaeia archaeon]
MVSKTNAQSKRREIERQALQIVLDAGEKGILQSDLWRSLGTTSREGSRISLRLERRKLIKRVKELNEERWTYRLYAIKRSVNLDSIIDCPCLICELSEKCDEGGVVSPIKCSNFTKWLLTPFRKGGSEA